MFKVNNEDTRTMPASLLVTISSAIIVNFKQVHTSWVAGFWDEPVGSPQGELLCVNEL